MKFILRLALFSLLGWGNVYAQSNLPLCPIAGFRHNCFATETLANGEKYVGEFKSNKRTGRGTFTYRSEKKDMDFFKIYLRKIYLLVGEESFVEQTLIPEYPIGDEIFIDDGKYVGEFKNGRYHGRGTFTLADVGEYSGEFKDGKFNGQGAITWSQGEKYVGEFKNHMFNGQGTLLAANGSVMNQGIFADNEFVRSAPVQQFAP